MHGHPCPPSFLISQPETLSPGMGWGAGGGLQKVQLGPWPALSPRLGTLAIFLLFFDTLIFPSGRVVGLRGVGAWVGWGW